MDEIHLRLLKAIQANPQATQRELSESLGVSLGKAHYCLRALVDKGWVKAHNFRANPTSSATLPVDAPRIDAKARLTVRFLRRKLDEYDVLRAEIDLLRREVEAWKGNERSCAPATPINTP